MIYEVVLRVSDEDDPNCPIEHRTIVNITNCESIVDANCLTEREIAAELAIRSYLNLNRVFVGQTISVQAIAQAKCNFCNGDGRFDDIPCGRCGGTGVCKS